MTISLLYKKGNLESLKTHMDKWAKVRNKIYKGEILMLIQTYKKCLLKEMKINQILLFACELPKIKKIWWRLLVLNPVSLILPCLLSKNMTVWDSNVPS